MRRWSGQILKLFLGLSLCLASFRTGSAEENAPRLPPDGTWVRYDIRGKTSQRPEEYVARCTYRLVGTKVEEDRPCRWVEIEEVEYPETAPRTVVEKFLVPETELLTSDRPLNSLVRGWRRIEQQPVEPLSFRNANGLSGTADFHFGTRFVVFPGVQREVEPVDESRVIEYQEGRLEVASGFRGKHVAERKALTADVVLKIQTSFTGWSHRDVPLGWAGARVRFEIERNGEPGPYSVCDWTVVDFGADAKTALPDHD